MDLDLAVRLSVLAFFGSALCLALLSLTAEGKRITTEAFDQRFGDLLRVCFGRAKSKKTLVLFLWTLLALLQTVALLVLFIIVTSRTVVRFVTFFLEH